MLRLRHLRATARALQAPAERWEGGGQDQGAARPAAARQVRPVLRVRDGERGARSRALLLLRRVSRRRGLQAAHPVAQWRAGVLVAGIRGDDGARPVPCQPRRRDAEREQARLEQSGKRDLPGVAGGRRVLLLEGRRRLQDRRRQEDRRGHVHLPGELAGEVPRLQGPRAVRGGGELRRPLRPAGRHRRHADEPPPPRPADAHQPPRHLPWQPVAGSVPLREGEAGVHVEPRRDLRRGVGEHPPQLQLPPRPVLLQRIGAHVRGREDGLLQPLRSGLPPVAQRNLLLQQPHEKRARSILQYTDTEVLQLIPVCQLPGYDPCSDHYVRSYLNSVEVQEALHARIRNWSACMPNLVWNDSPAFMVPTIRYLVDCGLRVWIYRYCACA
ncbi:Serine carboxypeptidase-like 40 [Zea mays]|uniref:Serine carboxypeptidase-like 40 n=1 Tax=Zea mays TaxID=4577 RepID=A0A1D6I616_MAIZE|nr:Serine carboxypeptidase-like 40 [Zea mays]